MRLSRLRERNEWKFFGVLPKADRLLAVAWWVVLVLRGVLPAVFAVAMGVLVAAVQRGDNLAGPLTFVGAVFVLLQVLTPIHQAISANLGDRTAAWLYDRLTEACVRPPGMGHLEDPTLTSDLTVARDFDLGMTGPPLSISMDFIASGLVEMIGGLASAVVLFAYAWWAPLVLGGAWLATHWLLRESAVWRDRNTEEVRAAQRDADYAYRLAVDPAPAKELRLFGLADWTIARFVARRTRLHALQYEATRLREKPVVWSLLLVVGANVVVFWSLANAAAERQPEPRAGGRVRAERGGRVDDRVRRAQLGARRRLGAGRCRAAARGGDGARGRAAAGHAGRPPGCRRATSVSAISPSRIPGGPPVLDRLRSHDSRRIVARDRRAERRRQDHAREAAVPAVRPAVGRDRDRRRRSARSRRSSPGATRDRRLSGFHRFELPLRDNVAPAGAPDAVVSGRSHRRARTDLAGLDTVLARGYDGGTDLSGGQWQRVALARALCAVQFGAGVVLLDEPTAQLDVRGEAEIFDRILAATRHCTTILVSHRFSTVRQADRICVLERGRVIELGTHDELMAKNGRYRTMFDLQAQRFSEAEDEEGTTYDVLG